MTKAQISSKKKSQLLFLRVASLPPKATHVSRRDPVTSSAQGSDQGDMGHALS
jgi:hypothetical protein